MSLKVFVLALLVCATTVIPGRAQNPFNPGSQPAVVNNGEDSASGTFFRSLFSGSVERIHHWQRLLRERITAYARQIEKSPTGSATLHFLAFTFVFGVLHALGPGHGKAIVCSYFLARRGTLLQALAFSNFITFMHLEAGKDAATDPAERARIYDTTLPGYDNGGHLFGDALSDRQRRAVLEYLKSL